MNEVVKAIGVGIIAIICLALLGPVDEEPSEVEPEDIRRLFR